MFTQGRIRIIGLCFADVIGVFAVWALTVWGYWAVGIGEYEPSFYLSFWPVAVFFVLSNAALDLYHGNWMYPSAPLSPVEEMRRLMISSMLTHAGVLAYLGFTYKTTDGVSRFVVAFSGIVIAFASQSFRNWARCLMRKAGIGQIPVLLAGGGKTAEMVAEAISGSSYLGMKIVGYFDNSEHGGERELEKCGIERLGSLRDITHKARECGVRILLACQDPRLFRLQLDEFTKWFTYIEYLPTSAAFPVFGAKPINFEGIGGIEMVNQSRMKVKRLQKRIMDTTLAALAFAVLSPLFVAIPLLVKLTSKGPVFYRQRRLGRNGREISVLKFRSMHVDADERLRQLLESDPGIAKEWHETFKIRNDPRITAVGRFLRRTSLDELPQLFNVFTGEMALIGPRPIVKEEVQYYGDAYEVFSSVRPGITGLWQVSGRSGTGYARRVALDAHYVLNWSPWMDVWILIRTIYAVLFMRGAY